MGNGRWLPSCSILGVKIINATIVTVHTESKQLLLLFSLSLSSQYDDLGLLPIPPKLRVHSATTLGRQDINSGDKIILSPQVLMPCEQQELSYPIVSEHSVYVCA